MAIGFAPTTRLTTWTGWDTRFQDHVVSDRTHVFLHQTSFEAYRGLWLRISPQIHWSDDSPLNTIRRLLLGVHFLPRTHWHVNLSYYHDRLAFTSVGTKTFLAQLHLYL